MHVIKISDEAATAADRDTVGGAAYLSSNDEYPTCRWCCTEMALFLQLDIREEFDLPFHSGSHLLLFMCPTHNEIPAIYYGKALLPEEFWNKNDGHYALILLPPGSSNIVHRLDPYIASKKLTFNRVNERVDTLEEFSYGTHDFKIGGVPGWINYSVDASCPCGGSMRFICQIPDGFGFRQTESAPEQPDSFSSTEYCLFLGNQVYVLGCDRQCNSRAVIAACDN